MKRLLIVLFVISLLGSSISVVSQNQDFFTIAYNNIPSDETLKTDWGFSVWIQKDGKTSLFDTGTRPDILKENLEKLNLDPTKISVIVISHEHGDHTGGLEYIIGQVKKGTKIYLPNDFGTDLKLKYPEMNFYVNNNYQEIDNGIWLTEVFVNTINGIQEQALVLEKGKKLMVLTGCAHPMIDEMCESVIRHFPDCSYDLVTGGFHLMSTKGEDVTRISDKIKSLGFKKLAPSHCTGEKSINVFKNDWGENFVQLNLGDSYSF